MSEKDKSEAAKRRGRSDFYKGVTYEDCPLLARDSIMDWQEAWKKAKAGSDRIRQQFDGVPRPCIVCGGSTTGSQICIKCMEGA